MKIKDYEINITPETAVDIGAVGLSLGANICVKRVIKEILKHSLPEPTKTSQKIIFKIGEYVFTTAIGAVVGEQILEGARYIKEGIKTIKFIREGLDKEDVDDIPEAEVIEEEEENGLK